MYMVILLYYIDQTIYGRFTDVLRVDLVGFLKFDFSMFGTFFIEVM